MKKFLCLQGLLLGLGISVWFCSEITYELSNPLIKKFLHLKYHLECSKILLHKNTITLLNCKFQNEKLQFSCPTIIFSLKNFLTSKFLHQVTIHQASGKIDDNTIHHLTAHLQIKNNTYRGFCTTEFNNIKNINIYCSKFLPIDAIYHFSPTSIIPHSTTELSINSLQIYIPNAKILQTHYKITALRTNHFQADTLIGQTLLGHEQVFNRIKATDITFNHHTFTNLYANVSNNSTFSTFTNLNLSGYTHLDFIKNIHFFGHAPVIYLDKPFETHVQLSNDQINAYGKIYLTTNLSILKTEKIAGNFSEGLYKLFAKNYSIPYKIRLKKNVNFFAYLKPSHISLALNTKHIIIEHQPFKCVRAHLSLKNDNHLVYKINFSPQLHLEGNHYFKEKTGDLICQGYVAPELTFPLNDWLPPWWQTFINHFQFYQKYPYANFKLQWNDEKNTSQLFGNVHIKQSYFKNIPLEKLNVTFGHQPNYFYLKINTLKTKDGSGACEIHWPYSVSKWPQEAWIFNGNGIFNVHEWQAILENFIENAKAATSLNLFDTNSILKTQFTGTIYSYETLENHLNIHAFSPGTTVKNFPLKNLTFDYRWTPNKTLLKNIHGNLFNKAPFSGKAKISKPYFKFYFHGENIESKYLIEHPLLKTWTSAIPTENLPSYQGTFELTLQTKGQYTPQTKFHGQGYIDFKNKNLSKIHLLGPLRGLFSKKLKDQPSIQFDQFVSNFSFTQEVIKSNQTYLLGPSARGDLQGNINLLDQRLWADIHFSFLDYQRLKFPIMRHLFQVFQPISKGFSANIQGTFKNPQWKLTFNPLRFVLPNSNKK